MKKIIYTLLIVFASTMTFSGCTEEEVAPNTENGGAVSGVTVLK